MDTIRAWSLLAVTMVASVVPAAASGTSEDVPYAIAAKPWPVTLGNHRACVQVAGKADAVRVHVPWRRRDPSPEGKAVLVHDAATDQPVKNVVCVQVNREFGEIVFQPKTAPGVYFLYYMPFTEVRIHHQYATKYTPPKSEAESDWQTRNELTRERLAGGAWKRLPEAKVLRFEARSAFHRFDPMEVVATAAETETLLAKHADRSYLLFPEDRRCAIRMTDDLPRRWMRRGPSGAFRGEACRGEFYVFQVGVYAARRSIEAITVECGPLRSEAGRETPAEAFRCFNLGGTDWLGRRFTKRVGVPKGKVQALWFGVQIPADLSAGAYSGRLTIRPKDAEPAEVSVSLTVTDRVLDDAGVGELDRLARLQWLDSSIGIDDEPTRPYTPLKVEGKTVSCLGRSVTFGDSGLPSSIRSRYTKTGRIDGGSNAGREILAEPMTFSVAVEGLALQIVTPTSVTLTQTAPGAVSIESTGETDAIRVRCRGKMEFDGYINYHVAVTALKNAKIKNVILAIPVHRDVARYMMGLGRKGGYRPADWQYKWDPSRANSSVWLGDVDAGLHCRLKGPEEGWYLYGFGKDKLPDTWANGGKGGCMVGGWGQDFPVFRAHTGPRRLKAGQRLDFRFGLLITPVKPLDPGHWNQRYYHAYVPVDRAVEVGANIINIHHGNELNPHINYPFMPGPTKRLADYVRQAHAKDVKVKIYYTVRELSNYVAEMWALRSLGHEVFTGGSGGGHSWLCEHLVSDYGRAWHHPLSSGEVDAAIAQVGLSRWHNYYLEGLGWLIERVGIDGIYLDGIGYDREIMKRVRRVMDRARPGCLIDFHSGNNFHPNYGLNNCANQYMEHFPYIDSLWFGEGFDYNESPDYWLVEISGLPFGLFGEMLQGGGNPWRGMVYGMTGRYYQGADPGRIWKVWDEFGIADAEMIGYWADACPVRTNRQDVLATVYRKEGKVLISLGSWAKMPVRCRLEIDWKAVGLSADKASLFAPGIQAFQPTALFKPTDTIPVNPGRGWLLILDEQPHELPAAADAYKGRALLLEDRFPGDRLSDVWTVHCSQQPGTTLTLRDGAIAVEAKANYAAYAERALPPGTTLVECRIDSGTDKGATWGPGMCLVWPSGKLLRVNLRAEGRLGVDDGASQWFGGVSTPGAWHHLRIRIEGEEVLAEASADGRFWQRIHAVDRARLRGSPASVRLGKMSGAGRCEDHHVAGPPGRCAIGSLRVFGAKP